MGTAVGPANNQPNRDVDSNLGEWAEELAALGKRRNILKKLREIAKNFIDLTRWVLEARGREREGIGDISLGAKSDFAHLS